MVSIILCEKCLKGIGCYSNTTGATECNKCKLGDDIHNECYAIRNPHRERKHGYCRKCFMAIA